MRSPFPLGSIFKIADCFGFYCNFQTSGGKDFKANLLVIQLQTLDYLSDSIDNTFIDSVQ